MTFLLLLALLAPADDHLLFGVQPWIYNQGDVYHVFIATDRDTVHLGIFHNWYTYPLRFSVNIPDSTYTVWVIHWRDTTITDVPRHLINNPLRVHPNPSNGWIKLVSDRMAEFRLFDMGGREVMKEDLSIGVNVLWLDLASGVYFYKVTPQNISGKITFIK